MGDFHGLGKECFKRSAKVRISWMYLPERQPYSRNEPGHFHDDFNKWSPSRYR